MADEFEQTERSRILDIARSELALPQIGEVKAVYPHTGTESVPTNHAVDVGVPLGSSPVNTLRKKPFLVPAPGTVATPEAGDLVLVQYLRGEGEDAVVTHVAYGDKTEHRAPKAVSGGVLRFTRGDLFIEVHQQGNWARIVQKPGDTDTPTAGMEIKPDGTFKLADGSGKGVEGRNDGTLHLYGEVKQHTSETLSF